MSLRLGVVVLAAGFGRRFGAERKLHQPLAGQPVLAWTLNTLAQLKASTAVVVVAPEDRAAAEIARTAGFTPVANPARAAGMGRSIASGVAALPAGLHAVLIALGDMPNVQLKTCHALLAAFTAGDAARIVLPTYEGQRGHPVVFGVDHFPALRALDGDTGARSILNAQAHEVLALAVTDPGVLLDIDTPDDLTRLEAAQGPR